jgi:putative FmdB family regulatory protein
MPIYEFECTQCSTRFEELVARGTKRLPCPSCGSQRTRRRERLSEAKEARS